MCGVVDADALCLHDTVRRSTRWCRRRATANDTLSDAAMNARCRYRQIAGAVSVVMDCNNGEIAAGDAYAERTITGLLCA